MATTFGPYSPVRKAGNYYFVSGQVGVSHEKIIAPDVVTQTQQVLHNLSNQLEKVGLEMKDVVKTTVFLRHMNDFKAVNDVYITYFAEPRPARSCVEVSALPSVANNELLVEIEAVAYKESVS
ncbi:MAG: hypothetical protein JWP13_573 [Candidatus Saccharibacteria bacterium]|nr:hypothetical protein [Candidatus Saccharibacteria bacterium]